VKQRNRPEIAEQKFLPLKKQLKVPYKKIQAALDQGILPDSAVLSDFIAISRTMLSDPGFGDEYYSDYMKACLAFEKSCKKNDFSEARDSFRTVEQLKHDCHYRK
jgi:XXXCH domain-containing protein